MGKGSAADERLLDDLMSESNPRPAPIYIIHA